MPTLLDISSRCFLQLCTMLLSYLLLWPLFRRLGQPQVVAMMGAGFALGPSVFGLLFPRLQTWIFPLTLTASSVRVVHPNIVVIYTIGQLGLVFYMFSVGASLDLGLVKSHLARRVGVTAATGVVTPCVLGGFLGWYLVNEHGYFEPGVTSWEGALFCAAAISITAFPMLAWIIRETGLENTRLGLSSLSCAASDDALSWILLAVVVAVVHHSPLLALTAAAGGFGFVLTMFAIVRPLMDKYAAWVRSHSDSKLNPRSENAQTLLACPP